MDAPETERLDLTPEHLAVIGEPQPKASGRSTPELLRSIGTETATLFRKEVQLARQELVEAVTARLMAAGAFAAAGVFGLFLMGFLGLAAAAGLDNVMRPWASRLIVAGGYLLLAAVGATFAIRKFKKPPMAPEETVRTVKEDVEWAKAQLKR